MAEWIPDGRLDAAPLYPAGPAAEVPVEELAPWHIWRAGLRACTVDGPSDVGGCLRYVIGDAIVGDAQTGATPAALPAAMVWERLALGGWRCGRSRGELHMDGGDRRLWLQGSLAVATPYARCLLDLARLLAAGLPGLAPGQSAAYYRAALVCRQKAAIVPDAAASTYAHMVKHDRDDGASPGCAGEGWVADVAKESLVAAEEHGRSASEGPAAAALADGVANLPAALADARARHRAGQIDAASLQAAEDAAITEAVRRRLVLLGVADNQVEAVSFGKEKPAVSGSDETAFEKNRRAEISYR
jgi:hypothetical protein